MAACVSVSGETPCWESRAAEDPGGEREGEAGQTGGGLTLTLTPRLSSQTRKDGFHLYITNLCSLQEEKERREQEEQRKKQDEDAKKKKALSNMTQQYSAGQKVAQLAAFQCEIKGTHRKHESKQQKLTCSIRVAQALVTKDRL